MRPVKQLTGFQTSDGAVHENIYDARKAQATLDLTALFDQGGIDDDVREWIEAAWNELEELMWMRACGSDPAYRDEH